MSVEHITRQGTPKDRLQPTSRWRLEEFKNGEYFTLYGEDDEPVRTIKGRDARWLKRILTSTNESIPEDAVRAFRPLFAVAFAREFDLSDEGETYRLELVAGQPKSHPKESEEEVYRRYWTGTLMPGGISAEDLAEKIIKSEQRVKVALVWGNILANDLPQMVDRLAVVIRQYNPSGERGR